MKKLFIGLFLICVFCSCDHGLSKKDTDYIDAKIQLHNAYSYSRYEADSASGTVNPMDTFVLSKPNLTREEFLNYCQAHNLDPIKTVDKLSNK